MKRKFNPYDLNDVNDIDKFIKQSKDKPVISKSVARRLWAQTEGDRRNKMDFETNEIVRSKLWLFMRFLNENGYFVYSNPSNSNSMSDDYSLASGETINNLIKQYLSGSFGTEPE